MATRRTVTLQHDQVLAIEQTLTAIEQLAFRHTTMLMVLVHGGPPPTRLALEAEVEQMAVLQHAVAILRATLTLQKPAS
jgi:hypothetical protein